MLRGGGYVSVCWRPEDFVLSYSFRTQPGSLTLVCHRADIKRPVDASFMPLQTGSLEAIGTTLAP